MKAYCDPILAEVMENKAKLLEMYGGIEGLDKHQEEERPRLEAEGWHFATPEEIAELQSRHKPGEVNLG
ncbi:MAG: hypothetical protein LBT13_08025 [Treponema sp.]|jgi:hypothetical protein|nr:hypothetical protein [Treponema sp.]